MNNSIPTSNSLPGSGWRRLKWLNTALLAFALATPLLAENGQDQNDDKKGNDKKGDGNCRPHIVRPDQTIHGKTYAEWGVEWYRWDLGNPTSKASSLDPTGANSFVGQSGPVWFLAGKSGDQVPVTRDVVVPEGKHIFFPLINIINDYPCPDASFQPGPGQTLEQFLAEFAKAVIDTTVDLAAEIDGEPVEHIYSYRAASKLFNFTADLSWNAFDSCITGTEQQGVADGYWLMLKPLCVGKHTIKIRGKNVIPGNPPFPFGNQDVTLNITVVRPAHVFPPKSHPHGKSYSEWAAKWWQWAYSFPAGEDKNPVQDPTGALGGLGQSGPVWFLAGSFGKTVTRELTVPAGKALFFPILNSVWFNLPDYGDAPWSPEQHVFALSVIAPFVDNAFNLSCQVDGVPVENLANYRPQTPLGKDYEITMPEGNLTGFLPAGTYGPCVDDGIWLMLKPLKEGEHTVRFTAASKGSYAGDFALDVTYHLTVAPKKH